LIVCALVVYNVAMDVNTRKEAKNVLRREHELERQRERSKLKKELGTDEGWLLGLAERFDYISSEKLSLLNWITKWKPEWYGNVSVVESYIVGWFFVELIAFIVLGVFPHIRLQTPVVTLILVIIAYRWYNIIVDWFHRHILTGRITSPVRTLLLIFINFAEMLLIFAIVNFLEASLFVPALFSILNSLDYTIRIMTTLGWDIYQPVKFGYVLFYVQVFTGIGTIVIILGSVMSYFTKDSRD